MRDFSVRASIPRFWVVGLAVLVSTPALVFTSSSSSHAATQNHTDSSQSESAYPAESEIRQTLVQYEKTTVNGAKYFDITEAENDKVDSRIVEIGKTANTIMNESEATSELPQPADLNPTNYGRWCGKNNSGPGDPINELDRACMGHDHCLNINRPTCDCDREFVSRLREIRGQFSGWARTYLEAAIIAVPAWHGCDA